MSVLTIILLSLLLNPTSCIAGFDLTVTAPSGTYTGIINGTVTNVRQFLGIPYALAPVGERRWLPPVKPDTDSGTEIPATDIGLACPQYGSRIPYLFNQVLLQYGPPFGAQNHTPGSISWQSGEDCLSLAVWTPVKATNESKLPVVVFIAGGGFMTGGCYSGAWYKPHHLVGRTEALVAVNIKLVISLCTFSVKILTWNCSYRLNIMGYPNARGLKEQNLGQMDQRMA